MSDAVQIALIVAAGPLALGIFNTVMGHKRGKKADEKSDAITEKLEVVHKEFNGMKDQLVAVNRSDAKQIGVKEGIAQQKVEQARVDGQNAT